ncbi:MAG: tetratricopeptide repeat protein [Candidatus Zixiibacteriota bacterium]
MKTKTVLLSAYIIIIGVFSFGYASAQNFSAEKIADKIYVIKNLDGGESQDVIASDSGLVVLNSFWSEITAQKYKKGIVDALKRDDFIYLIDLVDRLDMFGGNAAYRDIPIIGHQAFWDKYKGYEDDVNAEIKRLIDMWRWKENASRERLAGCEPGSDQAIGEENWMKTCKQRADDLEQGFSLVLPTEVYTDRKTISLGDLTLNLIWFGRAGYDGLTVVVIPEEKLAIISGFILHSQHLAPYPNPEFKTLDVPRWISVLEDMLESDHAVENVLVDTDYLWTREQTLAHLNYIRRLWNDVSQAEANGEDLDEIRNKFSLENEFSFVKNMDAYKNNGDDWIRPQHDMHLTLFFLQHKNLASEFIKNSSPDSISATLSKLKEQWDEGGDIYIDEDGVNHIGYYLLGMGKTAEAVELLKLNTEAHPKSSNTYDSYAEALMNNGDIEKAIANYKKSVELNPDNTNAVTKIDSLKNL